ncbi:quinone-dependent dihydroorotate dehydrogenase [Pseudohongiella spirulinae]|uniref:Dihydroorotate dehydrogenase (quinone) n=1 Tax=Pseudohongiella spirulinae TaxID=1249552 RepID=A0A0S2KEM3_9GAMM|nr:quinone-dependent dihydroorotate dehydrogenase [Pseudohongiella spirulinae]ALO46484.1 Dihydroorotate dehydrogenase (quinone) [Pseudohongiella spirulinae]
MYSLMRSALFTLPEETSHRVALGSLDVAASLGLGGLLGGARSGRGQALRVMGLEFPNALGLAAGLDKNADHIEGLAALGFGFIEIGTVTPRPQPGNPSPRLFRLVPQQAIINRMGFNNKGIDHALQRIRSSRYRGVLGINIGKNFDTPVEKAADDYLIGLRKAWPLASYVVVNLSSPNTPGLRTLQYGEDLRRLLEVLKREQQTLQQTDGRHVPLVIKIAPDLTAEELQLIAGTLLDFNIDGVIATNTTLSREGVEQNPRHQEAGGLSGAPLRERSTQIIAGLHETLQSRIPIIGVGGISSLADAQQKLDAGASLLQIYTGFIYRGPALVREIVEGLETA